MFSRRLLWYGFLVLNVAFAMALVFYVSRSSTPAPQPRPEILSTSVSERPTTNADVGVVTNLNLNVATPSPAQRTNESNSPDVHAMLLADGKTFGWQDIQTPKYVDYLKNLRAVGAPESVIRHVVFTDANQLFNQERLKAATTNDFKWWGTDNQLAAAGYNPSYQNGMQALVEARRELLTRLLGSNWETEDKTPSLANHTTALTGPVLGALPIETYLGVQEICARSASRYQDYLMGKFNDGQPSSQIELAKFRDLTRKELALILNPEQLEEFLLRFSQNSSRLRQDLRGLNLTPQEFRKIFRATDPIDHQLQLEYGSEDALSAKQREQFSRQREQAIAAVLGQDWYERVILSKDPYFRQAQRTILEVDAPEAATQPLYELLKSMGMKRREVQSNTALTPEQKRMALDTLNAESDLAQQQLIEKYKSARK